MSENISSVDKDLLKTNISKYLDLDKQIKEKQKQIKAIKDMKAILETQIIEFMREKDIPQIEFKEGEKLKLQEKISRKSISDKWLEEKFTSLLNDAESGKITHVNGFVDKLKNEISNRESTKRESLKYLK